MVKSTVNELEAGIGNSLALLPTDLIDPYSQYVNRYDNAVRTLQAVSDKPKVAKFLNRVQKVRVSLFR